MSASSCKFAFACNLTSHCSLVPLSTFCADTGSTHCLLKASDAPNFKHLLAEHGLTVTLPNGQSITSIVSTALKLPHLPTAVQAHVFADNHLHTSLLSISELCNAGCTATFTSTDVIITYNRQSILTGSKDPTSTLWHLPISGYIPTLSMPSVNTVQGITSDAAFVRFVHATFGSPALSTFHKAIRRNYLGSFPRLTLNVALAHPVRFTATAQGHLDQTRQGQQSSVTPILIFDVDSDVEDETKENTDAPVHSNHAFTKVIPMSTVAHSDLTGRFPITSFTGNQYVLVTVTNSYIHVEPMKTRHHTDYIAAYKKTINFFGLLGQKILFQRLDNETSAPLETFARNNAITIEYCPPHQHRSLKAERAIRTFKNHFIATLGTVDSNFPMQLWDELLPQTELCLNHLIPYAQIPRYRHMLVCMAGPSIFPNTLLHLQELGS